ncbi:hypothetical protein FWF48_02490 [Candidatus Saccharibacteria bacterium]|nr:hypothetical protein [Candidatus Saccharibacteria bacterium]
MAYALVEAIMVDDRPVCIDDALSVDIEYIEWYGGQGCAFRFNQTGGKNTEEYTIKKLHLIGFIDWVDHELGNLDLRLLNMDDPKVQAEFPDGVAELTTEFDSFGFGYRITDAQ